MIFNYDVSELQNAINSLTTGKAEFLEISGISPSTYTTVPAQMEQAFNTITLYNKPIVFHYTCNGEWSGLAYKYTYQNKSYGFIYALSYYGMYLGFMSADVFTCDQVAKESSKTEYVDLGGISSATYPTVPAQIECAFSMITITNKPVVFHYQCNGEWSGMAYKYTFNNHSYGQIYVANAGSLSFAYVIANVFSYKRLVPQQDVIQPDSRITVPTGSTGVTKSLSGLTANHVLIKWNFYTAASGGSVIAENNAPEDMEWSTTANSFTIKNNGSSTVYCQPIFALPEFITAS